MFPPTKQMHVQVQSLNQQKIALLNPQVERKLKTEMFDMKHTKINKRYWQMESKKLQSTKVKRINLKIIINTF